MNPLDSSRACLGFVLGLGVAAVLTPGDGWAVYQCDGEKDDCLCGKDNPFPCCSNGGNCTWWAWEAACCNWGAPALPTYGDAWHWKTEAMAAGWPMRPTPKVGTVFVRTVGGGDCGDHDCGHVGWVVSVDGNGGFCATEMACWGWYGVQTKCHSAGYADGGFICKKGTACEDTSPCTTKVTSGGETLIDDQNGCFQRYGTPSYWWEASIGYAGHMWYTYATDDPTDNYGVWTLNVADAGNYEVYAYVPENNATTHQAKYRIRHNGKETVVTVNQEAISAQFTSLGTHDFSAGGDQWVRLDDSTGEDYATYKRKVGFDAVKLVFRPSCTANCSGKQCGPDGCGGSCGECEPGWICVEDGRTGTSACVPWPEDVERDPEGPDGADGDLPDDGGPDERSETREDVWLPLDLAISTEAGDPGGSDEGRGDDGEPPAIIADPPSDSPPTDSAREPGVRDSEGPKTHGTEDRTSAGGGGVGGGCRAGLPGAGPWSLPAVLWGILAATLGLRRRRRRSISSCGVVQEHRG